MLTFAREAFYSSAAAAAAAAAVLIKINRDGRGRTGTSLSLGARVARRAMGRHDLGSRDFVNGQEMTLENRDDSISEKFSHIFGNEMRWL